MKDERIIIAHGEGGLATHRLLETVFMPFLSNEMLSRREDAAIIELSGEKYAFTTDGFIVSPIFFPGGDIGKLAACGTINDLAAMGAKPLYIAASFIIEEGFAIASLEKIAQSMSHVLNENGMKLVSGDTKVVPKGQGGEIFISAAGIGKVLLETGIDKIQPDDEIVISGDIARHAAAIICGREAMETTPPILSDCAPLWQIVQQAIETGIEIHVMRDPTRGGLATALVEIAQQCSLKFSINENAIPIDAQVATICDIYGFDPLYMANEGKMIFFVRNGYGEKLCSILRKNPISKDCAVIGTVGEGKGVILNTRIGGARPLIMLEGEQLPRIC